MVVRADDVLRLFSLVFPSLPNLLKLDQASYLADFTNISLDSGGLKVYFYRKVGESGN